MPLPPWMSLFRRLPDTRPAAGRQRWVVSLAGALALALLVWFLAPLVTLGDFRPLEDTLPRLLLIVMILAGWVLVNHQRDTQERAANERFVDALSSAGGKDPDQVASAEELAVVRDRLDAALDRLRTQRMGPRWGGQWVYQLPWYLVIGAPGSGKTTALAAAGLGSPFGEGPQALQFGAMGGTRTCDWWFTDRAVLIDTAGRYTTQDSRHAVDARVWAGLLDLLKSHRPRQPVNGVVLAVSLADLAAWNAEERRAFALTLRQRLGEVRDHLHQRCPVYIVCTKADLITGFASFFDTLGPEERDQVWGVTFPEGGGPLGQGPAAWFHDTFTALLRRLDERLMERLHQEPDLERRSLNFTFPLQVASLEEPLADLLEAAFATGPGDEPPLLRGIYFTSATQGGIVFDRLAGPFTTFGPAVGHEPAGEGQSCFLARLFPDVIVAEAGLAGVDMDLERALRRQNRIMVGGAAAAAVALAAFWTNSYTGNRMLVEQMAAAVSVAEARARPLDTAPRSLMRVDDTDFSAILPFLDALAGLPGGYGQRSAWGPLSLSGGLYQGGRLGALADGAYRRALRSIFLSRILLRLEEQLRVGWALPEQLQAALMAYRMLGGQEPINRVAVMRWIAADWDERLMAGAENDRVRAGLKRHLEALFDVGFAPVPLDDVLIKHVESVLAPQGRPGSPV